MAISVGCDHAPRRRSDVANQADDQTTGRRPRSRVSAAGRVTTTTAAK